MRVQLLVLTSITHHKLHRLRTIVQPYQAPNNMRIRGVQRLNSIIHHHPQYRHSPIHLPHLTRAQHQRVVRPRVRIQPFLRHVLQNDDVRPQISRHRIRR
ncbi:hypothetical protein HanRHA438_Chr09g0394241 [Helianthus annuus]|nr:hypothetical protein HanIR_Chr09g0412491 [Helianthus annuus]KAJ0887735.1 hypothetical protein HanRHA438_Chr09g0394241 [Helianthus annuus]